MGTLCALGTCVEHVMYTYVACLTSWWEKLGDDNQLTILAFAPLPPDHSGERLGCLGIEQKGGPFDEEYKKLCDAM